MITLWHVLEHLEDPIGILRRLNKLLTRDGTIFIEVPNADDALLSLLNIIEKAGLKVRFQTQVQRYPLANHLYWLFYGKPGGHVQWNFMCSDLMDKEYEHMLVGIGKADTLVVEITKCDNYIT